jgi:hypothetical protein
MANSEQPKQQEKLAKAIRRADNEPTCTLSPLPQTISEGGVVVLEATVINLPDDVTPPNQTNPLTFKWSVQAGVLPCGSNECETDPTPEDVNIGAGTAQAVIQWDTKGLRASSYEATVTVVSNSQPDGICDDSTRITVLPRQV